MKYALLTAILTAAIFAQSAFQITTPAALPSATAGAPYSVTLQASGGQAPYLWFQASPGLPPGLLLDAGTGILSGKPSAPGTFTISLYVLDSSGTPLQGGLITGAAEANRQFVLTVN